jgi:hypothetical protein
VPLPSSPSYHHAGHRLSAKRRRGFALLITITLLAFLVLLLVSLASLTRVETSVAANNQSLAQARQNALLALNIAVGQLQKYAGPDARVTARAEITSSAAVKTPYFTGVWDAAGAGPSAGMWLVSGSEVSGATAANLLSGALDPSDDTVTADTVFLVGNQSVATNAAAPTAAEKTRRIKLAKQDVTAQAGSVPGLGAAATPRIGRYAWWVGDQGVKASLALPDRADEVTYAPWSTPIQRRRIRQQIAATPNYFRASDATTAFTKEGFDPLSATGLQNVKVDAQLGLLTPTAGSMTDFARGHYHDFTTSAYAVLANTRSDAKAGLMRDLSLKPDELGAAFKAYSDYQHVPGGNDTTYYMETPGDTVPGAVDAVPAITDGDSPRRRYRVVAPVASLPTDVIPELDFRVAPVLEEMLVQFSVQYAAGYKVGVRIYTGLWNPYSSAIVPPGDLYLTISGFPQITLNSASSSTTLNLQSAMPSPVKDTSTDAMRVYVPFKQDPTRAETYSWLPGRVYGWTTKNNSDGAIDEVLKFENKDMGSIQRWYYPVAALPGGSTGIGVSVPAVPKLTIELRSSQGLLATYTTPAYSSYTIPSSTSTKWFSYAFRLKQASNINQDRTWLKTFDPRDPALPATVFGGFDPNTDTAILDPAAYTDSSPVTVQPGCLLYRIQGSTAEALSSYNDAPLFELPRRPLLSVGELQHLSLTGKRPFSIGNSWGGAANVVFDRFFMSGLPTAAKTTAGLAELPDLSKGQPLPNWNLQTVNVSDAATLQTAGALSSEYLLQAGGFNVNSTSVAAWRAVLSGVRMKNGLQLAAIENNSGVNLGTQSSASATLSERFAADATLGTDSSGLGLSAPVFYRFPQSAQETYFWKKPSPAANARAFNSYAYRLGVRGYADQSTAAAPVDSAVTVQRLTTDQIEMLAEKIVTALKIRAAAAGPFRTLEEFLSPMSGAGSASLIEKAIDDAGLNPDAVKPLDTVSSVDDAGFSSLTLTQGDILTALAPYMRVRSDTFMTRTYGEALNPVTGEVVGRAWLEATVQRLPSTVQAGDNIGQPTGVFGRQFKIISFRWLSPSDI